VRAAGVLAKRRMFDMPDLEDDNEGGEGVDRMNHRGEFEGYLRLHWLTFAAVEGDRYSSNNIQTPL